MSRITRGLFAAGAMMLGAAALAAPAQAQSRGELLYATNCIACHSTQMHWRDAKRATDWTRLRDEVRRWQATADLAWSEDDIVEVTRYLNERFYRFDRTSDPVSSLGSSVRRTPSSRPGTARARIHAPGIVASALVAGMDLRMSRADVGN